MDNSEKQQGGQPQPTQQPESPLTSPEDDNAPLTFPDLVGTRKDIRGPYTTERKPIPEIIDPYANPNIHQEVADRLTKLGRPSIAPDPKDMTNEWGSTFPKEPPQEKPRHNPYNPSRSILPGEER